MVPDYWQDVLQACLRATITEQHGQMPTLVSLVTL